MHPLIQQQLAADHVNDMIAAAVGSRRARQGAPPGTHPHPPLPLEPRARIAAADRSADSCRLRRAIRNPGPEVRHVPTPAPMPAG